jgi:hypothetical protein
MALITKSMEEIRDDYLRTYKAELQRRGIINPNVSFGTEIYIKATALAQQIAVAMQNTVIEGDALMPDTAQDEDLQRLAGLYNLFLKPSIGSIGSIILKTTIDVLTPILISAGQQLQDSSGLLYQVINTGSFKDGDFINLQSIDTGIATNIGINSVLKWVTIPAYAQPTASVGTAFIGGFDAENIEQLRVRLLEKLANPAGGGNWSQVADSAQKSNSTVEKAFVYPACNGPATTGVAVTSAASTSYKGRDFNDISANPYVLNNFVIPGVIGDFPENVDFIINNCVNKPIDLSIGLSLPYSKLASTPGNGTGWIDANPIPIPIKSSPNSYLTGYCSVDSVDTSKQFIVNCDNSNIDGYGNTIYNIGWISKIDWKYRTAKATSLYYDNNMYQFTLLSNETPFSGFDDNNNETQISAGDYVFPAALNMENYINAILEQFASLGPGEKISTSTKGLFPRAHRRPLITEQFPCDLGPSILKFLSNTGPEVLDVQYLYKQNVGSGSGKCPVPTSVRNGPYILTPNNIGIYPIL